MALQVYKFSEIVQNVATAMQASATAVLNFTPGSVLRAISEATAGVVLWLQAIILQLLTLTRAATSTGADLDSWMADYGLARLPATFATGQVTFSRFTAGQAALIPFGAIVQTADGTQRFAVVVDTSNAAYTASGYVIPAGTASATVPVQAASDGGQGNVLANSITTLSTAISYVDTVTNISAFTNGIDAESDPAFRSRFFLYIASLTKGTRIAVDYAVRGVRQGLTDQIIENQDYDGTTNYGMFCVIVDDGTGYPSSGLLNSVTAAVDAIRPLTVRFAVYPPVVVTANVGMSLTTAANYAHAAVTAAVAGAISAFINAIPLGSSLPYTQLAAIAYSIPGVTNATGILLNGGTADLVATKKQKLLAGSVAIS